MIRDPRSAISEPQSAIRDDGGAIRDRLRSFAGGGTPAERGLRRAGGDTDFNFLFEEAQCKANRTVRCDTACKRFKFLNGPSSSASPTRPLRRRRARAPPGARGPGPALLGRAAPPPAKRLVVFSAVDHETPRGLLRAVLVGLSRPTAVADAEAQGAVGTRLGPGPGPGPGARVVLMQYGLQRTPSRRCCRFESVHQNTISKVGPGQITHAEKVMQHLFYEFT